MFKAPLSGLLLCNRYSAYTPLVACSVSSGCLVSAVFVCIVIAAAQQVHDTEMQQQ